AGLINAVVENAIVPVIETGTGIVHVYVDKDADDDKALSIINNAKTSRPSVCNAMEVLLVHEDKAASFLPRLEQVLVADRKEAGLEPIQFRLDSKASQFVSGQAAQAQDL
ncbi:gamma-glutamyl-phosphate reductase, partial [Streptococcus pneumoniae]|nr:gamma-glutamyl-phosphate reductase [Streptococcus pneumoniae]